MTATRWSSVFGGRVMIEGHLGLLLLVRGRLRPGGRGRRGCKEHRRQNLPPYPQKIGSHAVRPSVRRGLSGQSRFAAEGRNRRRANSAMAVRNSSLPAPRHRL